MSRWVEKGQKNLRLYISSCAWAMSSTAYITKIWIQKKQWEYDNVMTKRLKIKLNYLDNFNETIKFTKGYYVVHLPCKTCKYGRCDNLTNTEASAWTKFDNDPALEAE
ncbi:hypothetical protein RRG08_031685 [Elysia crispata]|uniref:Uncharacterized protein n=1 Tax=Elysia crispata TaxID=231223 RepID=A0AAE1A9L3_9GAST|nr:hypothetical protein RRG08_031685 [Elysia crispata]